jgi:DNA sulfur modification protein DndB
VSSGYHTFPAIRGRQGEHTYYLTQCPLRLLSRLFLFDEAEVPFFLRQMHSIDHAYVLDLVNQLSAKLQNYTLSPLVAVADRELAFEAFTDESPDLGHVRIPLVARLIIQDGQHRRIAISQILVNHPSVSDDTVPVMLIPDPGLSRAPGIFADLNPIITQRTQSQKILHDNSDLATLVRQFADEIPLFQGLTELEKTTISNRSTALFTLSAIFQATQALVGIGKKSKITAEQATIAQQFWLESGQIIPEWRQVINREVTAAYLRQHYIHAHTVTLIAIGIAGHALLAAYPDDWGTHLQVLASVDWSRKNAALWEGRAMVHGRMSKTQNSINLTAITLKRVLGLSLTEKDLLLEEQLAESKHD